MLPHSGLRVTPSDYLRVQLRAFIGGLNVYVNARILLPSGDIVYTEKVFITAVSSTSASFFMPLHDGAGQT